MRKCVYEEYKVVANILSRSTSYKGGYTLLYKSLGRLHSIHTYTHFQLQEYIQTERRETSV